MMMVIGLMSGTSLDGIDAALVEVEGESTDDVRIHLRGSLTLPYEPDRRERIHAAVVAGTAPALCALNADLGEWFADAAGQVAAQAGIPLSEIDVVGSHGQTVWHTPPTPGERGATLQLGDAATIAERTGCTVVADFRTRDMAAGGHGAPLVAWTDGVLFAHPERGRALQNIGGIGNVTLVPPRGSGEPVVAFDTGPGNALVDAAVEIATQGRLTFDRDGQLGGQGEVDAVLLDQLLAHPFFAEPPPRSTGREAFGRPFVQRLVEVTAPEGDQDWLDLIATLTEFTARSIADAYARWLPAGAVHEVVVTGGGARNPTLVGRIRALLHPVPLCDAAVLGIDPDAKEAVAFAMLAWAHMRRIPANVPTATGAAGPRVLGSCTPGAR